MGHPARKEVILPTRTVTLKVWRDLIKDMEEEGWYYMSDTSVGGLDGDFIMLFQRND